MEGGHRALVLSLVALIAAAIAVGGGLVTDAQSANGDPSSPLKSGFHVAPGTRLLAVPFPTLDEQSNASGWRAVLTVSTDAASALRLYEGQAARLGYRSSAITRPLCIDAGDRDVTCRGLYYGPDSSALSVVVQVCKFCDVPIAEARLEYDAHVDSTVPTDAILPLGESGSGSSESPTARLSRAQMSRMLAHRGSGDSGFAVERGSRLLAPPTSFDVCPDLSAIVEVTGDPHLIQRQYGKPNGGDQRYLRRARVGHEAVTEMGDEYTTSILVQSPNLQHPVLMVEHCSD